MAPGDAEITDFWTSFLRSLRERGLKVPSPQSSWVLWGVGYAVVVVWFRW